MDQVGLDGADDDVETAAQSLGPGREGHPERPGEAQHSLPHGDVRYDMIHEVRGRLDHACFRVSSFAAGSR
jgi:hypothetical protein